MRSTIRRRRLLLRQHDSHDQRPLEPERHLHAAMHGRSSVHVRPTALVRIVRLPGGAGCALLHDLELGIRYSLRDAGWIRARSDVVLVRVEFDLRSRSLAERHHRHTVYTAIRRLYVLGLFHGDHF